MAEHIYESEVDFDGEVTACVGPREEVVRCRNCKHFVPSCGCRFFDNAFVGGDFFCAAGEWREDLAR